MKKIRLQALMSKVVPIDEVVTLPNLDEKTIEDKLAEITLRDLNSSPLPPVLMDGPVITEVE